MKMFILIICLLTVIKFSTGQTHICTGQTLGEPSPDASVTSGSSTGGSTYVLLGAGATVPCCGVISQWNYATGAAGPLTPQVWTQSTGNVYEVVGQNDITGLSTGVSGSYSVATADQISVESGYKIGWHSTSAGLIPYEATASAVQGIGAVSGKTASGGTATLPASLVDGEQWQFGAILAANSPPSFGTSLPENATAGSLDTVGTVIYTVTPTDDNPDDIAALTVSVSSTSSSLFDLVGNDVQVNGVLTVGTYYVVLEVADHCEVTATATLTVTVTNTAPNITSLPVSAALLREDATGTTSLHALTFTDDGPLTDVTCSISSTTPSSAPFVLKYETGTSDYFVYYQEDTSSPLDYETKPLYSLWIVCNDGDADSVTKKFEVSIQPDDAPVPNIPAAGIEVSALTTGDDQLVYTVTATDTENDDHTFAMSCTCPFKMLPNGKIYSTQDLNDHRTSPYTAYVNVSDGHNLVGPAELIITITDINTPPTISNPTETLPNSDTVHVSEHTDEGTPNLIGATVQVLQAMGADVDGDTLTWEMTFDNGQGEPLYTFDTATGIISTNTDLDYETLSEDGLLTTTVNVRAFDGREYSETRVLNIVVDDVNETPVFNQALYTTETREGTASTTLPCSFFEVFEEDNYDTRQYDLDCGNAGIFTMPTSRTAACDAYILQTVEYDLDAPGAASSTVTCAVVVTDKGGLTASTSLEITIHEEDDNWPFLDKSSYAYTITNATNAGAYFGNADVTDDDFLAEHRRHTFSTDSSEFGVDETGVFFSKVHWENYNVPTSRTFNLMVRDEAGHTDTAPVTVTINPVYTTTTTTTTQAPSSSSDITSFFDDPGNLAWFIPAILLSLVALGLLGYLLFAGLTGGGCKGLGGMFGRGRGHGRGRVGKIGRRGIRRHPPPARVRAMERRPVRMVEVVESRPATVVKSQPVEVQQVTPQSTPQKTPQKAPPKEKSSVWDCLKRPSKPKPKQVDEPKSWHLWGKDDFMTMDKGVG